MASLKLRTSSFFLEHTFVCQYTRKQMTQKLGPSTYTTQLCNPHCRWVMQLVERLAEGKGGGNPIRYIQCGFIFEITVTQLLNQNYKG